jgi:hypothetical protein
MFAYGCKTLIPEQVNAKADDFTLLAEEALIEAGVINASEHQIREALDAISANPFWGLPHLHALYFSHPVAGRPIGLRFAPDEKSRPPEYRGPRVELLMPPGET